MGLGRDGDFFFYTLSGYIMHTYLFSYIQSALMMRQAQFVFVPAYIVVLILPMPFSSNEY